MWWARDRSEWVAVTDEYRVHPGSRRCSEAPAQRSVTVGVCGRRRPATQIQGLFRFTKREHRGFDCPAEGARQHLVDGYLEFADARSDRARFIAPLGGEV